MTTPSSDREVRMQNQSHRIGPLTLAASLCRSSVSKLIVLQKRIDARREA
jgi:hypothetical protein